MKPASISDWSKQLDAFEAHLEKQYALFHKAEYQDIDTFFFSTEMANLPEELKTRAKLLLQRSMELQLAAESEAEQIAREISTIMRKPREAAAPSLSTVTFSA